MSSIFAQDYPRLEVILVNDGSLRSEDRVVKELAVRYPSRCLLSRTPAWDARATPALWPAAGALRAAAGR